MPSELENKSGKQTNKTNTLPDLQLAQDLKQLVFISTTTVAAGGALEQNVEWLSTVGQPSPEGLGQCPQLVALDCRDGGLDMELRSIHELGKGLGEGCTQGTKLMLNQIDMRKRCQRLESVLRSNTSRCLPCCSKDKLSLGRRLCWPAAKPVKPCFNWYLAMYDSCRGTVRVNTLHASRWSA